MNKIEYLLEIMKIDVERIDSTENDISNKELELIRELKEAEERCDLYEEMYEDDEGLIMSAYRDYERIRNPITSLESSLMDFKLDLINHYEQLLIEKKAYDEEIRKALATSKYNVTKMDETVNIIRGVLI